MMLDTERRVSDTRMTFAGWFSFLLGLAIAAIPFSPNFEMIQKDPDEISNALNTFEFTVIVPLSLELELAGSGLIIYSVGSLNLGCLISSEVADDFFLDPEDADLGAIFLSYFSSSRL